VDVVTHVRHHHRVADLEHSEHSTVAGVGVQNVVAPPGEVQRQDPGGGASVVQPIHMPVNRHDVDLDTGRLQPGPLALDEHAPPRLLGRRPRVGDEQDPHRLPPVDVPRQAANVTRLMHRSLLDYLACPGCGTELECADEVVEEGRIDSGILRCCGCGRTFPVVNGVPRMNVEMDGLENVARTFGYEWKAHHEGAFEQDTLFGRTRTEDWQFFLDCMGTTAEDVSGAVVLDAGCGSGSFTRLIGEHGAEAAIGVDINEAVDEAYELCADLPNVHIVQGNVFSLPFKRQVFDLIWCSGVLHHTPDAARGHASLARHIKPGGTLYVWVYAKRFNPFRSVKSTFDAVGITRLPEPALEKLAKAMSYPSLGLLWLYRGIRSIPGLRPRSAWGERTVRPRTLQEIQLTWFDALSPEFDTRHTEAEVTGWFEREGFERITAIDEPKVGVRAVAPVRAANAAPERVEAARR
jgi:SAM-dependent methyltransferase/uncharacterized protein YbaR (Trm112 family)